MMMKMVLFFVILLAVYVLVGAVLFTISDLLMIAFKLTPFGFDNLLMMFVTYLAGQVSGLIAYALLVPLLLVELFYRYYRFGFKYYLTVCIIVIGAMGLIYWEDPFSYVSAETTIMRFKIIICHLILGVIYAFLSEGLHKRSETYFE